MKIELTRYDGGLRIQPCPLYISKFLKYQHREMQMVQYKRQCVFVAKLLYAMDGEGAAYTLPGFFHDVVKLIGKAMDTMEVKDFRTPMPEPDWHAVKQISLRDYQKEPALDLIFKGLEDSGVVNAAGGFGA